MYNHKEIEPKWQNYWEENKTFKTELDKDKPKYYILDMFPYPSGAGLHVGHPEGYTATDIVARYKRMNGFNVLHPMGWDAFGLPAENYAIKTGTHPRIATEKNIETFKRQIQSIGFSYDWDREVDTTDPNYYKWTQWIFVKLFEKGLAYEEELPINWCPSCKTGLANEEVTGGICERCKSEVERKNLRQWVLRITVYAEKLLTSLEDLDWPEPIKEMQRNWIGKSEGCEIEFEIDGFDESVRCYTTRADTIFGVNAIVLAPENTVLDRIVADDMRAEVDKYIEQAGRKSDLQRTELEKEKTGVFTGAYAINPANGEKVQIWVADYVLGHYGTGAVMSVPGSDYRDNEFAKKFDLPTVQVITGNEDVNPEGELINSGEFNGLKAPSEAKGKITEFLVEKGVATKMVNYKLRDWVFSRQRYWGEPIPVVHCDSCGPVAVPEDELPLTLPDVEKYEPTGTGESPLAAIEEWVNTKCPKCGELAKRETNTMPQWGGSCWYYLRYMDPSNSDALASKEALDYFGQVDMYVGGAEHAVLHLLYARFWNHFLHDIGVLPHAEPFYALRNQGMILGTDGQKMSKSRGNVINPDDIIQNFGADTLRMYEMFMGPFEQVKPWDMKGVEGIYRFLHRAWSVFDNIDEVDAVGEIETLMHKTIKKVGEDIQEFRFNTAISQMMIFVNALMKLDKRPKNALENLVLVLSPFAPHISEELWSKLGHDKTLAYENWPEYDEAKTIDDEIEIVVQVNGKLRDKFMASKDIAKEDALSRAKESEIIQGYLDGKELIKEIYVPGKLVNLVVK